MMSCNINNSTFNIKFKFKRFPSMLNGFARQAQQTMDSNEEHIQFTCLWIEVSHGGSNQYDISRRMINNALLTNSAPPNYSAQCGCQSMRRQTGMISFIQAAKNGIPKPHTNRRVFTHDNGDVNTGPRVIHVIEKF